MNRALLCLALCAAGCGDEFSNAPFAEDARFVAAAPSASVLRIGGPGGGGGTLALALTEEPAETYVITRQTSLALNTLALALVREVDDLVMEIPAERGPDTRLWRPPPHALDPVESRFWMRREGGAFAYSLGQRRRALEGEYAAVIEGRFEPTSAKGEGAGLLTFDLDAAAALGGAGRGRVHVDYTVGAEIELVLHFEGFAFGEEAPSDAVYRYVGAEDGSGTFDFAFTTDEGVPVEIRSRWRPDGAGRADLRVGAGAQHVVVSECWGAQFVQVFYEADGRAAGDPALCAFAEASLPPR